MQASQLGRTDHSCSAGGVIVVSPIVRNYRFGYECVLDALAGDCRLRDGVAQAPLNELSWLGGPTMKKDLVAE